MKKIFIAFTLVFLTAAFSNQLMAQTTASCTPAQVEACKKICGTAAAAKCTTAQKAACNKVCTKSAEAKVASYDPLKVPAITAGNTASCQKKMSSCTSASSVKLTANDKPSCMKSSSKVVENKKASTAPIAQKVALETTAANN